MRRLRSRVTVLVVMSVAGALFGLLAIDAGHRHHWAQTAVFTALASALLTCAALMAGWAVSAPAVVQPWGFDVTGLAQLRCLRCDGTVLPAVARVSLPRLMYLAQAHAASCRRPGAG